jgi:FKBP-type peptidyl-prolyl cis-trans isomerase SlyD
MTDKQTQKIEKDIVVTLDYTLEVDGQQIDEGPIQFIHGHDNIIPGLEKELEGMQLGDKKEILVKAADAYGEYDPEMEVELPLSSFPDDFEIQLGRPMRLRDGEGHIFTGVATAITDEKVKLNLNHPLAGKDLVFKTEIADLRPGTEEEIKNGRLQSACAGCSSDDCGDCD